jgi:hypothetical protein
MFPSDSEDSISDSSSMPGLLLPNDDSSDDASSLSEIETESRRFSNAATPVRDNEDDDSDSDNSISMPSLANKGFSDSEDDSSSSDSENIPPLLERGPDSGTDSYSSNNASDKMSLDSDSDSDSDSAEVYYPYKGLSDSEDSSTCMEDSDMDDMPVYIKNVNRIEVDDDHPDKKGQQERNMAMMEERKLFAKMRVQTIIKQNDASIVIAALCRGFVVRQRNRKAADGFTAVQAIVRGMRSRRLRAKESQHIRQFREFRSIWSCCLHLVKKIDEDGMDWASLKDKQAYIRREEFNDGDEMKETDEKLTDAMADAMKDIDYMTMDPEFEVKEIVRGASTNGEGSGSSGYSDHAPILKRIHLSGDVVKWLRQGDRKYRDFFIRRMKQLATGESSRILQKRLFGSENTIYETYLEQKSGFRILWTEKDDYLLVWYVAKHKNVSRLMKLIDDSKNRSERQRVSITEIEEFKNVGGESNMEEKQGHEVFLDPLGNVPLKVYNISTEDIDDISEENWTPNLHLTEEERDVVETRGTVLLLGRSGTGERTFTNYLLLCRQNC